MTNDPKLNPGEERTRLRNRRQIIYLTLAGLIGGAIGFFVGFFDQGDGNLFQGDLAELSLPPTVAVILAIAIIGAFIVFPLWGFTQIDDYKRQHNLIGFTGGCLAMITAFPVWGLLYAGGFAPEPTAYGVWLVGFISLLASYLFARFRA